VSVALLAAADSEVEPLCSTLVALQLPRIASSGLGGVLPPATVITVPVLWLLLFALWSGELEACVHVEPGVDVEEWRLVATDGLIKDTPAAGTRQAAASDLSTLKRVCDPSSQNGLCLDDSLERERWGSTVEVVVTSLIQEQQR